MSADAWLTVAIVVGMVVALAREVGSPDLVVLLALIVLLALGILTPEEALAGFANPAMVTVGALFVVAQAISATGALDKAAGALFGQTRSTRGALLRLTGVSAVLSAFLNNTPVVATFMPVVDAFSRRTGIPASKLLIPLSYAAVLGGACTLIGTSTNLVVSGFLVERGMEPLGLFELSPVGVPATVVGLAFIILVGPYLLPDRRDPGERAEAARDDLLATLQIPEGSPLDGKTVAQAGLRGLHALFLARVDRADGGTRAPAAPETLLRAGDRLTLAGDLSAVPALAERLGLTVADGPAAGAPPLVEAVVSYSSELAGRTLREVGFRGLYGAVVVGIYRGGERLRGRLADVEIAPGDTLVMEAAPGFGASFRDAEEFYLVTEGESEAPMRAGRMWAPLIALVLVVGLAAFDVLPVVSAALVGAVLCVLSGALARREGRRAVDASVLVVIGASFGLATAMETTGAAAAVADTVVSAGQRLGSLGTLAALYITTAILTEAISNNAAAALMFPIAMATAERLSLPPHAFAVGTAVASSMGFLSPLGYQTHLMVYGAGGYRFVDFFKIGAPVQVLVTVTAIGAIWLVWM